MELPKIANIVAVADLGTKINLTDLTAKMCKHCQIRYDPIKFRAAIIKTFSPIKATFLLWSSGKLVSLGSNNFTDCEHSIKNFIEIIKNTCCPNVFYSGFFIENIVTSFNFGKPIDLNEFRKLRYKCTFYEPEIFCGLKYQRGNSVTALIFYTGKLVITGGRSLEEINDMYYHILPYLKIAQIK